MKHHLRLFRYLTGNSIHNTYHTRIHRHHLGNQIPYYTSWIYRCRSHFGTCIHFWCKLLFGYNSLHHSRRSNLFPRHTSMNSLCIYQLVQCCFLCTQIDALGSLSSMSSSIRTSARRCYLCSLCRRHKSNFL